MAPHREEEDWRPIAEQASKEYGAAEADDPAWEALLRVWG
jgi:hypothetical protein